MQRRYRRVWRNDPQLDMLAAQLIHGMGCVGELVESWVWSTSAETCCRMLRQIEEAIDLQADAERLNYWRLWSVILRDRIENGDRL